MTSENQRVAITLFMSGEFPSYSTGICDNITAGYGKLDWDGYWQYPLPDYLVKTLLSNMDAICLQ